MKPIDFEKVHRMFDGVMIDICSKCAGGGVGLCEENTIALFMPGEAEYIASKLNLPFELFAERYVKTLTYKGRKVFGLIDHCYFLDNEDHRCTLEKTNSKLITCLVYPVTLGYPGDPERIFLDTEDCPMAHQVSEEFRTKVFGLLEIIVKKLPDWWLEINAEYCWPLYDYEKLAALKDRKEISLEELKACEMVSN